MSLSNRFVRSHKLQELVLTHFLSPFRSFIYNFTRSVLETLASERSIKVVSFWHLQLDRLCHELKERVSRDVTVRAVSET